REPTLPGLRSRAAAVRAELCCAGLDRAPLVAAAARRVGARLPRRWLSGEAALRLGAAAPRATGLRSVPVRRSPAARPERRLGGFAVAAAKSQLRSRALCTRTNNPKLGPIGLWRPSETRATVPHLRERVPHLRERLDRMTKPTNVS